MSKIAVATTWTVTVILLGVVVNCNTTARIRFDDNQLSGIAISNAQPKRTDNELPQCDVKTGDPTRLLVSTVIFGQLGSSDSSDLFAVRPGDSLKRGLVDVGTTVGTTNFTFTKSCIQADGQGNCSDADINSQQVSLQTNKVEYFERMGKSDTLGLVILLDQSGSISGAIEANGTTFRETDQGLSDVNVASDPSGIRLVAIQSLIAALQSQDKVLVLAYSSKGLRLVCNLSESDFPDFNERAKRCFSANKTPLTDPEQSRTTINSTDIQFNAKGRSNMWEAVKWAIEFHAANSSGLKPQILVVNDGPDTCTNYEGFDNCSTVTVDQVKTIATPQVPVHFVQFTSRVHTARDTDQQLVSCLTRGEYIFVSNVNGLKDNGPHKGALTLARFMMQGTWLLHVNVPALSGRPGGNGYLIQSVVNFDSTDLGDPQQFLLQFDPDTRDSRLHVYKP
ncbi:MAG: hypothetical protein KC609_11080 [Myxococcales bacterium]|nr:hypothetical protein [Myxococcales bacterium]